MRKILLSFLIFLFAFIIFPSSSLALENFTTDYNVTYNVLDNTLTHVTFDVTLSNKTAQYYASSYSIQVGFKNIESVSARDTLGNIIPKTTKNENGNSIEINFNDKVVGLNRRLNFSISFDTNDIAQKSGKIWDINIPGLAEQIEYNSFNVKVIVPASLGSPSYIKPDIGNVNNNILTFTKDELGKSGISISFGQEEIYDFNLFYHLKNSNLFPVKTEIALPPSTNYQDVQIIDINPKPENVILDVDGNWLAQYKLDPSQKLDIEATGKAKILLRPKKEILSKEETKRYLKEQPYWQTTAKEIKDLASKLKTPFQIYQYVVDHLTYDFDRVTKSEPRIGALEILKNPSSAICLQFTDLFITIARAAGIPAREVNGFAFTKNEKERPLSLVKDILHAWPEYYDFDLSAWVMVDPTWGNTTGGVDYFYTLDFDHFAFAIKGDDSNYPIPAGGYKTSSSQNSKDINVNLGEDFSTANHSLTFSENFEKKYFSGFNVGGKVLIKNAGNIISTPQKLSINTTFLEPRSQKIYFDKIPPFGYIVIPVIFNKPSLLTNKTETVKIAINENYLSKQIFISPFIFNIWTILGGIIFVSIALTISFIIYRTRHISILKRKE